MSIFDELELWDDIREEVQKFTPSIREVLLYIHPGEIVVMEVLPLELQEIFLYLCSLERKVTHEQQGLARFLEKAEAVSSADARVVLDRRNDLSILVDKRDALRALFYGTLKKHSPKHASGKWAIRRGFTVVVTPAWDPATGEACAGGREAFSK